ncbi:probable dolichyl pyrophosphate Glc1Man9GlcNAc2 alpha-1,3-glucosyltransferase isoform X2 [Actinia tenebrosa]|nr:probable dolichyl pyrophosphate Glc1Man9GlcNAc2 alpha-1,3-glucosyltransferase isoform X2 [Actinia tenebrosa]
MMVVISSKEYASTRTIVFQRVSVIVTDLVLAYGIKEYCHYLHKTRKLTFPAANGLILALLVIFNFGLLIVDHIHFQYNGFLFGMLLLSITRISEGRNIEGAFWFSILLNFKHIFLYIAPAFFVYLLRSYCFKSNAEKPEKASWLLGVHLWDFSPLRLMKLGFFVIFVFVLSFGPFILLNQLPQLFSRLFPFKRGLCHAYWAPNIWALYNVVDKAVAIIGPKAGLIHKHAVKVQASMTGGLVGQSQHLILPSVPPIATVILTLLSIMPALLRIWYRPDGARGFLRCLTLCAYGSFLFGWHVHEKAVIMIIIPLSLLAVQDRRDARVYLILASAGHLSLFPLLFRPEETTLKVCLMMMFTILAFYSLCLVHCGKSTSKPTSSDIFTLPLVAPYEAMYLSGLAVLEFYNSIVHHLTPMGSALPFLPLLFTSVYCAVGVVWSWLLFYKNFFSFGEVIFVPQPAVTTKKKKR